MIVYIVKTVLCSGLLLAVYRLLLQKEKMHHFNRAYLLFSVIFSLLVPLIAIEGEKELIPFVEPTYMMPSTEQITALEIQAAATGLSSSYRLNGTAVVYGIVSLFFLFRFARNVLALLQRAGKHPVRDHEGARLVLATDVQLPYSFLRWIFVDKESFEKGGVEDEILRHELAHVNERHSLDILFMELILAVAWFNPFFYGLRKAIRLNHEFLADADVLRNHESPVAYQRLLLRQLGASPVTALTSSFHYLLIKKRLIMMTQKTSPQTALLKKVAALPFFALLVFAFGTKPAIAQPNKQPPGVEAKPQKKADSLTTYSAFFTNRSIGSTKEGASSDQVKEYEALAEKNFPTGKTTKKNWEQLPKEDKAKMEGLFRQMSGKQQLAQRVFFMKPAGPFPKEVPSERQLENFKNPGLYGLWIDGRKAPNSDLNNHVNTDFSHVFVSRLFGAAKKGRSYTHQADLMTNAYYENYVKETVANKESGIAIKWPIKEKE